MKISNIETHGCRGVADHRYCLASPSASHPLVAITGAEASGKTSLLDAIAAGKEHVAPYGVPPSPADIVREGLDECKIVIEWALTADEHSFAANDSCTTEAIVRRLGLPDTDADIGLTALLERYSHEPTIGKVDYFPDDRRLASHGLGAFDLVLDQKRRRLTRGADKYAAIGRFAREALQGSPKPAEALRTLFARLCPRTRLVGVNALGVPVFHGRRGSETPVEHLSFSERMAFLFAATFVMVGLHESVVLIDTPELGLGPGEAARFLRVLMDFAPTTQFIVATRDPGVLELAGPEATLALEAA